MAQGSGALVRMGVLDTTPWLSPLKAIHFTCTKRNHPRSSGLGSGIPMKKTLVFVSRERKCIAGACFRGSLLDFCPVSFLRRRRQSEHRYPSSLGPSLLRSTKPPKSVTATLCSGSPACLGGSCSFLLPECLPAPVCRLPSGHSWPGQCEIAVNSGWTGLSPEAQGKVQGLTDSLRRDPLQGHQHPPPFIFS